MSGTDPYEFPFQEQLWWFQQACVRSGGVRFWKGVLLACHDGKKPPFSQGDLVRVAGDIPITPIFSWKHPSFHIILPGKVMMVSRVLYQSTDMSFMPGDWAVTFHGIHWEGREPHYVAGEFALVKPVISSPSR